MTCQGFDRRLQAYLDGALAAEERRRADAHLSVCAACRELAAFASGELGRERTRTGPHPPDLTAAVLDRTTGPSCSAAQERLADLHDGRLAPGEADLVRLHLGGCAACSRLAESLAWVARELPEHARELADVPPDDAFVRDVVRATEPMLRRARRAAALRSWAAGLAMRPRFALEGAYAGALAAWLVFQIAGAPAQAASTRALELATVNPVAVAAELARPAAARLRQVETAGLPVAVRAHAAGEAVRSRVRGAAIASWSLAHHGAQACGSAMAGDFEASAARLDEMGRDLLTIWSSLFGGDTGPHDDVTEA